MINLYQLQLFLAVVDRGTFSAAANELHLTQPAISLQVRALEDRYNVRLFNRQGQRLELTEAGQALVEPARRLVTLAQQVEEGFSAGQGTLRGRLNVVYSHNSPNAHYLLPEILGRFHPQAKTVQFSLQAVSEEVALEMLLDFQAHFALLSNAPRSKSIEAFLLHSDELVLAVPATHPWNGQQIDLAELRGQTFIMSNAGSEIRRLSETTLRIAGVNLSEQEIIGEVDSPQAAVELVANGLGLAFLNEATLRKLMSSANLGLTRLKTTSVQQQSGLNLKRESWLARYLPTADRTHSPAQNQFWEFTQQNCPTML